MFEPHELISQHAPRRTRSIYEFDHELSRRIAICRNVLARDAPSRPAQCEKPCLVGIPGLPLPIQEEVARRLASTPFDERGRTPGAAEDATVSRRPDGSLAIEHHRPEARSHGVLSPTGEHLGPTQSSQRVQPSQGRCHQGAVRVPHDPGHGAGGQACRSVEVGQSAPGITIDPTQPDADPEVIVLVDEDRGDIAVQLVLGGIQPRPRESRAIEGEKTDAGADPQVSVPGLANRRDISRRVVE